VPPALIPNGGRIGLRSFVNPLVAVDE